MTTSLARFEAPDAYPSRFPDRQCTCEAPEEPLDPVKLQCHGLFDRPHELTANTNHSTVQGSKIAPNPVLATFRCTSHPWAFRCIA